MLATIFIILILLLAYCFFCVDSAQGGFKAACKIKLITFLEKVIPVRYRKLMDKVINYVINKPNPIVQVRFLLFLDNLHCLNSWVIIYLRCFWSQHIPS